MKQITITKVTYVLDTLWPGKSWVE